ncbi:MAG: ABC transporter permease [Betaproteobacteria bacterium]|nr:ABC transporter permease [Betaproteobacteria bacterium]
MKPILALARTDIVLYLGNRKALLVSLVAPILIAAFFGSVLGGAPKKAIRIPIAVTDLDGSAVSKKIVAAIAADATFEVQSPGDEAARDLVRRGKIRAAVVLPKGFGDEAAKALFRRDARKPEVTVHYDPSQSTTLALVKGLLAQHAMQAVAQSAFSPTEGRKFIADSRRDVESAATMKPESKQDLLALFDSLDRIQARAKAEPASGQAGGGFGGFQMPFATKEIEVTSGERRKYNAYAHSFAGMGVQFVLFMGVELGMGLLLMRRQGIWKRLRAAPITRSMLLSSRIVSGTVIAVALMIGIYAAGIAAFDVRIEGSVTGFIGVLVAFGMLTATFGLLIAALGGSPEATRGIAIVATLLMVMLGGAWVPTFVFPDWLQTATLAMPTRWAIDGLAAMTWRGLGIEEALAPIGVMLAFSVAFGLLALARFRWEE